MGFRQIRGIVSAVQQDRRRIVHFIDDGVCAEEVARHQKTRFRKRCRLVHMHLTRRAPAKGLNVGDEHVLLRSSSIHIPRASQPSFRRKEEPIRREVRCCQSWPDRATADQG